MAERWWRYSYSYSHVSTMHHAGGAGVGWIMRDTHQAAKTKRAQPRQGLGGCIQSFILRATGKLPLKFFFLKQGNHMLRSTVFQVPQLQDMHSADRKGARAPPARTSGEEPFASSLGKR